MHESQVSIEEQRPGGHEGPQGRPAAAGTLAV